MIATTTIEHVIDAEAAIVFDMWTTGDGLQAWWGVAATTDPRPGGTSRGDSPR